VDSGQEDDNTSWDNRSSELGRLGGLSVVQGLLAVDGGVETGLKGEMVLVDRSIGAL